MGHSSYILRKKKTKHHQESDQTLAQAAQRRYAISIFGDVQDLPGCGLEQPGPVRPILRRLEVSSNINDDSVILII